MLSEDIVRMLAKERKVDVSGHEFTLRSPSLPESMTLFSKFSKGFGSENESDQAASLFGFAIEALRKTVVMPVGEELTEEAASYLVGDLETKNLSEIARVALELCGLILDSEKDEVDEAVFT